MVFLPTTDRFGREQFDSLRLRNNADLVKRNEYNFAITVIRQEKNNNLWLGTYGFGLISYNMVSQKSTNYYFSENPDYNIITEMVVPACSGATFTPQPTSPTLTVTNGYIDVIQESSSNGGDLVLVEIWSLDGHVKSADATLDMQELSASVKLYPNPTSSNAGLNIELKGFENETNATISIMDISGRIAYSTNVQTQNLSSQRVSISLDGVSSGMYMVSVRGNNKVINQRLIIK